MNINDKIKAEVLSKFKEMNGRMAVNLFEPIDGISIIIECIRRFRNKHDEAVLILVDNYPTREKIVNGLKELHIYDDSIKILSYMYFKPEYKCRYELIITYGVEFYNILSAVVNKSTFHLVIFNKAILNKVFIDQINSLFDVVTPDINANAVKKESIYSPVEDTLIPVAIPNYNLSEYKKADEFVKECITIFGDLKTAEECRVGNKVLNISAATIRQKIATENGWNENLDTRIEINKQIDDTYNPNNLLEKAEMLYSIINVRNNIAINNKNKLKAIYDIVKENKDKKILIISKSGEFAEAISKYLNDNDILSLSYHDEIPKQIVLDEFGNAITYKSGANAGKVKLFGAVAISKMNLNRFNIDPDARCLSIKFASNVELTTAVDIVIITTTMFDNIYEIKTRYSNLSIVSNPNIVYTIFTNDSIEEKRLKNLPNLSIYKIIKEFDDIKISD